MLGVIQPGPLKSLSDQAAERDQQGPLRAVQPARLVEADQAQASGLPGDHERHEGPCLLAAPLWPAPQLGEALHVLPGRGDKERPAIVQGGGDRGNLPEREAMDVLDVRPRITDGPDHLQVVGLGGLYQQSRGAERRQDSLGHRCDHVLRGHRLGQGGRQFLDLRRPPRGHRGRGVRHGRVPRLTEQPARLAAGVSLDPPADPDPADVTIRVPDPELDVALPQRADRVVRFRGHPDNVVRMHDTQPGLDIPLKAAGIDAEHGQRAVIQAQLAGSDIPRPGAHLRPGRHRRPGGLDRYSRIVVRVLQ